MAKYKVDITGINTSEIEVLSNEEMTKLFLEYQNGNLDAKDRLINGNLKLVLELLIKVMLIWMIYFKLVLLDLLKLLIILIYLMD